MASSYVVSDNIMKNKVIIIIGATGTGKSRLSIDLATRFPSEIINSDKIQVYKGLDIVSNKVLSRRGLVDEVREIFDKKAEYNRGVRRAIGVPEMHEYFLSEAKLDKTSKDSLLASSIGQIKENTCALTRNQVWKILRLRDEIGWNIHRFDATSVLEKTGVEADRAWNEVVLQPCMELVTKFLTKEKKDCA